MTCWNAELGLFRTWFWKLDLFAAITAQVRLRVEVKYGRQTAVSARPRSGDIICVVVGEQSEGLLCRNSLQKRIVPPRLIHTSTISQMFADCEPILATMIHVFQCSIPQRIGQILDRRSESFERGLENADLFAVFFILLECYALTIPFR